jgi:hypothetical protein
MACVQQRSPLNSIRTEWNESCGVSGSRYDDDDGHWHTVLGQIDGILSGNGCRTYDDNKHSVIGGTNSGYYNIDGGWDWGILLDNRYGAR